MQKRDIWGFIGLSISLSMLSVLFSGCQKYYYLDPADLPPTCLMNKFTCTVDGDNSTKVTGTITTYEDGSITELSDWGNIYYRGSAGRSDFDFKSKYNDIECEIYFDADGNATSANYDFNYKEKNISYHTSSGGKLRDINIRTVFYTSNPDFSATINNIVYDNNGNLVSYTYEEKLTDYPYTTLVGDNYLIEYDMDNTIDHSLFPNEHFFWFNYRPILGDEYSLGERFDPQPFSKNLVLKKTNLSKNKTVFENTYGFDNEGRISEMLQTFLYGGYNVNTLKWTYQYTCE